MKHLIAGLVLALISQTLIAQKAPIKFGEIPLEDLKMTSYDKDSSAAAVILTDYGEAYITVTAIDASLQFERHVRIKILKKEGLDWANGSIPLFHSGGGGEKISSFKAATYNLENGKVVETRMSYCRSRNFNIVASFSSGRMRPCSRPSLRSGKTSFESVS